GVEDARDAHIHAPRAARIVEQGLGSALALIVAGALAYRIDMPPVALRLWMDRGITIYLGGGSMHDAAAAPPGHVDQVLRAEHAGRERGVRVALIVNWGCGA